MNEVEQELNKLFELCEKANKSLQFVDSYTSLKLLREIQISSQRVFLLLEVKVNKFGVKDLSKDFTDKKILLRLYFILMKSLSLYKRMGNTRFEDARSMGSVMLAYKLMFDLDFEHKFGQSQTWINNDTLYTDGLLYGINHMHNTLLQSLVRCLTNTLNYSEIKCQKVPDYMNRFEEAIVYYLQKCNPEDRIYLDFV